MQGSWFPGRKYFGELYHTGFGKWFWVQSMEMWLQQVISSLLFIALEQTSKTDASVDSTTTQDPVKGTVRDLHNVVQNLTNIFPNYTVQGRVAPSAQFSVSILSFKIRIFFQRSNLNVP